MLFKHVAVRLAEAATNQGVIDDVPHDVLDSKNRIFGTTQYYSPETHCLEANILYYLGRVRTETRALGTSPNKLIPETD